jgi:predicted NUDIX family phosphoesterase
MNKEELKAKYGDVEVFVVCNEFTKEFDTFVELDKDNKYSDIFNAVGKFIPRHDAELNFEFRQLIPYCLVKCNDNYFITRRLEGDVRLTGKYSLGVGGHLERVDGTNNDYIKSGMMRELDEEIDIKSSIKSIDMIGMICSNNTEVDSVHLGLIYVVEVAGLDVAVKETETLVGDWISKDDLINFNGELESWSKIAVDKFIK